MSKIVINNVNLELDLLDADVMEKYQATLTGTVDKANALAELTNSKEITSGESMRRQCRLVDDFVDELFGEGTSAKVFPRKNHLGDHLKAWSLICQQAEVVRQETEGIIGSKYSPNRLNRSQRRQQQKNNKHKPSNYSA